MTLNAKQSGGQSFKLVISGCESRQRFPIYVREEELPDSSPSQGEDSRGSTGHGCHFLMVRKL